MALQIIETYEYEENGLIYIYTKYQRDNGGITEERVIKQEPQTEEEPQSPSVTNEDIDQKLTETQNLLLDTMSGVAEMYELLAETQNLQLDTMSGIADMYELAMTKEGGN